MPAALRERARQFVEHPKVQGVIITLILVNAVLLGLETWPTAMAAYGPIIVNAMQTYSEAEHQETVQALEDTRQKIEADVCDQVRELREEILELKDMLTSREPTPGRR